jgi:hypothetical protein
MISVPLASSIFPEATFASGRATVTRVVVVEQVDDFLQGCE